MIRWILTLLLAVTVSLQADDLKKDHPQPKASETQQEVPPEEDQSVAVQEYSFNPLQAEKEVRVGNFYFKKGSYHAAAMRFREATKWNAGYSEAWLRLGEAEEKQKDRAAAKEAYTKYLALASDSKEADGIRKKLAHWK
ncbi:MAG TPA: tetratricopeptide repeat protein [Bryobacteraceae bacterium]|nr:tetratricopeptide repeat protein [Bryobacteraceae bacterium]